MVRRASAQPPHSKNADIACQQITALIVDYVTGELDPRTTLAFKAHLQKCPDCIAFLSTYQKTVQAAQSLRYESIPLQMRRRVRQFLRERIKGPPP
jgi:anti-sigma factor RsiW